MRSEVEFLKEENDTFRHLLKGYHLRVRAVEDENQVLVSQLDSFWDQLQELEDWVDKQESWVLAERGSSVIDLTGYAYKEEEEEIVEIPGFPDVVDIPQTLVPLEDENLPGEVCIP